MIFSYPLRNERVGPASVSDHIGEFCPVQWIMAYAVKAVDDRLSPFAILVPKGEHLLESLIHIVLSGLYQH